MSTPKPRGQWVGNLRAENGGEVINDTAAHTGTWFAFQCIEDTVVAAITQTHITNEVGYVGLTLQAGFVLYGETSSITLTSGSVLAVNF